MRHIFHRSLFLVICVALLTLIGCGTSHSQQQRQSQDAAQQTTGSNVDSQHDQRASGTGYTVQSTASGIGNDADPASAPVIDEAYVAQEDVLLRKAIAGRHGVGVNDVTVAVDRRVAQFADGTARVGTGSTAWIGFRDGNRWTIVHEGASIVSMECSTAEQYSIPHVLVNQCLDEDGVSSTRAGE